jgi:hypothetical protein
MTTGITQVAVIPGAAFYEDYEDTPMAPSTFSSGVPTNYPVIPNTGIPVRGCRLIDGIQSSRYAVFVANPDLAGVTNFIVTFWLGLEPNAKNVDLVNHNVRMDAAIGILTSGTSLADDSALGTPVAATVTMGSSVGVVSTQVTGNITTGSVTAGSLALLRIRRLGTDALDTNSGSVILLGASITAS